MKLTYYGHSCFSIETNLPNGQGAGKKILFDPFISPNELAKDINIANIEADYILVSHGHADHIADCVTIAQSTGALVICNWEIYQWLNKNAVSNIHPMNTGGSRSFDGFSIKCTAAQHSSSMPDGSDGGNPMGFIIYVNDEIFYYSGDTALTMDMQLIPKWAKLNFAVLPIGDNFTMGVADAVEAAGMIGCNNIVGVHYDTFGYIKINHEDVINTFAEAGMKLHLPGIGSTINI